jgi:hypothetical protein
MLTWLLGIDLVSHVTNLGVAGCLHRWLWVERSLYGNCPSPPGMTASVLNAKAYGVFSVRVLFVVRYAHKTSERSFAQSPL